MSKLPLVARLLLGLGFTVFGLVGLLNLIPPPPNMPEKVRTFMTGMMATGYFFPFLKGTEVVCGLLLLSGFYVPLALVVLAPILLNILLLHAFLDPSGLMIPIVLAVLEIYLAFFAKPYSNVVRQLFQKK